MQNPFTKAELRTKRATRVVEYGPNHWAMFYQNTQVFEYKDDIVLINTGGYNTKTTCDRINWCLSKIHTHTNYDRLGYVYRHHGQIYFWYVKLYLKASEGLEHGISTYLCRKIGLDKPINNSLILDINAPLPPLPEGVVELKTKLLYKRHKKIHI